MFSKKQIFLFSLLLINGIISSIDIRHELLQETKKVRIKNRNLVRKYKAKNGENCSFYSSFKLEGLLYITKRMDTSYENNTATLKKCTDIAIEHLKKIIKKTRKERVIESIQIPNLPKENVIEQDKKIKKDGKRAIKDLKITVDTIGKRARSEEITKELIANF